MAKQLRQARAVARAVRDWLRYDLREIVFPSSMPDPPGLFVEPKKRRGPIKYGEMARFVWTAYLKTWRSKEERVVGTPKEQEQQQRTQEQQQQQTVGEDARLAQDLAGAAVRRGKALKPYLAELYQTRLVAYQAAVQQFVEGYKRGFREAMQPEVPQYVAQTTAHPEAGQAATQGAVVAAAGGQAVQQGAADAGVCRQAAQGIADAAGGQMAAQGTAAAAAGGQAAAQGAVDAADAQEPSHAPAPAAEPSTAIDGQLLHSAHQDGAVVPQPPLVQPQTVQTEHPLLAAPDAAAKGAS